MQSNVRQKINDFFAKFSKKTFGPEKVLVEAGEEPQGIYYLLDGLVRQFDISASGQKSTLNIFKPGAFFPMSWAINKTPNEYFFECLTPCSLKVAPVDEVLEFVKNNSEIMYDLLSRVYRGTDGLLQRQSRLMSGSAEDRLAYELWVYCVRFHKADEQGSYNIKIKKSELASFTGLARETVSRQVKLMEQKGLIKTSSDGFITVDNLNKLQSI